MELNLKGRSALITGGSKGIGKAVAETFAEEGCDLHLVARGESDLEATRNEIAGRHQVSVTSRVDKPRLRNNRCPATDNRLHHVRRRLRGVFDAHHKSGY